MISLPQSKEMFMEKDEINADSLRRNKNAKGIICRSI